MTPSLLDRACEAIADSTHRVRWAMNLALGVSRDERESVEAEIRKWTSLLTDLDRAQIEEPIAVKYRIRFGQNSFTETRWMDYEEDGKYDPPFGEIVGSTFAYAAAREGAKS